MVLQFSRHVFSRYEVLVVFRPVRMWSRKSAGRHVRVRARFLKLLWVPDGYKFGGCDAGADKPTQDSIVETRQH